MGREKGGSWMCDECGAINQPVNTLCWNCDVKKVEAVEPPPQNHH